MLVGAALLFHSILLTIIAGVSILTLVSMFRGNQASEMTPASAADRVVIAVAYFALAGLLGWYYFASEIDLVHLHGTSALRS